MDGNGRWARQRGLPRVHGHRHGAAGVKDIVYESGRLGVQAITLYSFSLENWKRPDDEVSSLMELYVHHLTREREDLVAHNIRFLQLGRREGLPEVVLHELDRARDATKHCTGLTLALALNYGSRAEITDAVRRIAERVKAGELRPTDIHEHTISENLYTGGDAGLPDPDLLIRTAGEWRVSNFLLWQISYAEIFVTDTLWPDFTVEDLHTAIRDYASRQRRFGGVDQSNS